jgi:transcriptional regulator with XRE-family HTH domain
VHKSVYSPEQVVLQRLLKSLRVQAGMLQGALARILDKPQSFVSRYESGAVMLDLPQLRQVCQALGLSLRDFVELYESAIEQAGGQ